LSKEFPERRKKEKKKKKKKEFSNLGSVEHVESNDWEGGCMMKVHTIKKIKYL